jgi:ATP phosphoribosyltransferase regulatory subunit
MRNYPEQNAEYAAVAAGRLRSPSGAEPSLGLHATHWPLPQGVADFFLEDAAAKRDLEEALRRLFSGWAYSELIPPSFEYADTLASEAGTQLAEEMYRFVDRDGRTLALRPDLTIPTARVVATRLYDQPLPLRLFYVGSVFRYEAPQAGRQREFTQAGVELVGAGTAAADAEVLALTVQALRTAGLHGFHIALGQMAFFRSLLAEVAAPPAAIASLQSALDRQNSADLHAALAQMDVTQAVRQTLLALPHLNGGPAILTAGYAYCLNDGMAAALARLQAIHDFLAAYDMVDAVSYDLGETRGMAYYTGITFKAYAPGLGFSVCSGGRYDDLVGHFGPQQPAVGCALWLDRLLLARQRQGWRPASLAPDLILSATGCQECLAATMQLRQAGWRVELDVLGRVGDELWRYALLRGARMAATCAGSGQALLRSAAGERQIAVDAWLREVTL